ncbi:DUF1592 domain-containing protein [Mariniblastus fucicola]|nr:DUF1592 domain-containing protein [Mariniblastus fucicola]
MTGTFSKILLAATAFLLASEHQSFGQDADVMAPAPESVRTFLEENCLDCHQGSSAEAGFDIDALSDQLDHKNSHKWSRVFDRVRDREMPPVDYNELDASDRKEFLKATGGWISNVQTRRAKAVGRVGARRLTNLQLERTLHDLLGINIPLENRMPDEPRTGGFTTVASGQSMSHFQLEQHVNTVDLALDNAFKRAFTRKEGREKTIPAKKVARPEKRKRCREPELIDGHAVTWCSTMPYYGRIPASEVEEDGWYRFTIRAKGLNLPKEGGVWCTIRSGRCISSAPLLSWIGAFEAGSEIREVVVEAWMTEGQMLEIRPGDATLKKAWFDGGQVQTGKGEPQNAPGVAIKSMDMQRIEPGPDNDAIRKLLFAKHRVTYGKKFTGSVKPEDPDKALKQLLYRFAKKAFRRPIKNDDIAPYLKISLERLESSGNFVSALRVGYRAILCSPRFMYFYERPGKLDDFSIAARMSYMLWNRMLDEELWLLASKGQLSDPKVVKQQVARMLRDPRGKNFVVDFADQWLDMNQIDFTEPDRRFYPGFDPIVERSMLDETHRYLQQMIDEDLSVTHLIDSDFTFLNSRLAKYYGVGGSGIGAVDGDQIQKVSLRKTDHRGGLITHGSVLKVTSNGNNTSPVVRGVWVSERLLGEHIPPPPENVPAIEPDIRGAKSIRDQLAKHKNNSDCASCHRKIDPPGFALENFDPSGRWRTHYGVGKKKKKNRRVIDASFEMASGKKFKNLNQFKALVLKDKQKLAQNVAEKLMTYGTGETIQFADRDDIKACVSRTAKSDYGFESLIKEVVASELFMSK